MGTEVHLWRVDEGDRLTTVGPGRLDLEERLEAWLEADIAILDPGLLVIGRQVHASGGPIDLLCMDVTGDLVIVELKRDRTPRDVTAQALDYASWVDGLSHDRVTEIADGNLARGLEDAFREKFNTELPETLNEEHRILVVGSEIDASTERILRYLSDRHGVNINAATFDYFQSDDGQELLARVFVIEPSEVESNTRNRGSSKRQPRLTYAELRELAEQAGVVGLYDHAVSAFEASGLQKKRTRTTIGFKVRFDRGSRTVISFVPGESSDESGMRYQLYHERLAELTGLSEAEIVGLLPPGHESVGLPGSAQAGIQGFLKTREEIDRIAAPLSNVATTS
jgi:hypothetical protein